MMPTSDAIERAALKILEREGHAAVSMRRVAKAVKITPMAIYHHFENRETLLRTVVDREFSKFLQVSAQGPLRRSHEAILLHSLDAYIHYSFEHPRIFDYVFSEQRLGARRYPEDFRAGRSPTLNLMAELVSAAMADNYLKQDDVWEVAFELWAHVHGFVMLYRGGRINFSEAEFTTFVQRSLKRLFHGLKNQ